MKLSLDRVWDRIAAHWNQQTFRSENYAREEECIARAATAKATSKVSLDDFNQGGLWRTIASI